MKAHITANGFLIITPENETEDYALKRWQENYCVEAGPVGTISSGIGFNKYNPMEAS